MCNTFDMLMFTQAIGALKQEGLYKERTPAVRADVMGAYSRAMAKTYGEVWPHCQSVLLRSLVYARPAPG